MSRRQLRLVIKVRRIRKELGRKPRLKPRPDSAPEHESLKVSETRDERDLL